MDISSRALLVASTIGSGCCGAPCLLNKTNYQDTSISSVAILPSPLEATLTSTSTPDSEEVITQAQQASEETPAQPPVLEVKEEVLQPTSQPPVKRNEGNCSVVSQVDSLETLLYNSFSLNPEVLVDFNNFFKVDCSKTVSEEGSKIPSNWDGLFPKVLFENGGEVEVGKKIEIKLQNSEDSTKYKTTFSGSHFYKDIVGEWVKSSLDAEEESVTAINIVSPSAPTSEKIYLMFKNKP